MSEDTFYDMFRSALTGGITVLGFWGVHAVLTRQPKQRYRETSHLQRLLRGHIGQYKRGMTSSDTFIEKYELYKDEMEVRGDLFRNEARFEAHVRRHRIGDLVSDQIRNTRQQSATATRYGIPHAYVIHDAIPVYLDVLLMDLDNVTESWHEEKLRSFVNEFWPVKETESR